MILVFDLDDTLYKELSYVKSGFRSVAVYLAHTFHVSEAACYEGMLQVLHEQGRGKVFDSILEKYGKKTKEHIKKCVSIYRTHNPQIQLNPSTLRCFERFKDWTRYIVTDGNKIVQDKKVQALELYPMVKKVFITYRYGLKHAKPSPYCFQKIAALEQVDPSRIVYIGDNPTKDFVGIKPLGFKTIRILTGGHKDLRLAPAYEAHMEINSLDELTETLLTQLAHR